MTVTPYRLVYYSQNRIAGSAEQVSESIEQILAASRRNNSAVGITGALMFNSGYFAQVLEGAQGAVEATFERIQKDERHGEVSLLSFTPAAPTFGEWSMAFVGKSIVEAERFGSVADRTGFDPSSLNGDRVFEILRELMTREESVVAA